MNDNITDAVMGTGTVVNGFVTFCHNCATTSEAAEVFAKWSVRAAGLLSLTSIGQSWSGFQVCVTMAVHEAAKLPEVTQ